MKLREATLPGCHVVEAFRATDERGSFEKGFTSNVTERLSLGEVFLSRSKAGVLRGLHFQEPPNDQHKLVWCLRGRAHDVMVDLRSGSPTEGRTHQTELVPGVAVLMPPGIAHGFLALENDTELLYCVSEPHAPDADTGIRWDSAGIAWPIAPTTVSARDQAFVTLADYASPFRYE